MYKCFECEQSYSKEEVFIDGLTWKQHEQQDNGQARDYMYYCIHCHLKAEQEKAEEIIKEYNHDWLLDDILDVRD